MHRFGRTHLLLLSLSLFFSACSKPESAEQRLRTLIQNAAHAAEQRDASTLRGYVSERYLDDEGRDRRTVEGILRLYVLRNQSIHLLTRIDRIGFPQPGRADAIVYVAMAARPIASAAELGAFHADLYRFELGFADESGEWRLMRSAWRPAEAADFIRG